jgi:two-component system OmpR family sensor kinase
VADASHELRTPLTSIRGYVDLLREGGEEPAERADMLRRMSSETGRMTDLVEDLLLLARLDAHRPLHQEPVDLRSLLEDAALDARVLQPDRPITLDIPGRDPLLVTGDALRLQQVVAALVHNALAHTDPTAAMRLAARLEEGTANVVVADQGAGMDEETAAHAFDRFVRGDGSRSRASGGAGLGLAIAQAIVEAHGGTLELETAPGEGSRFTITLPR